jgi:hypothetical protein
MTYESKTVKKIFGCKDITKEGEKFGTRFLYAALNLDLFAN